MTEDKTPRTKTQTLSLRLDPKTRFVLEFIAKLRRQSITTVVEDAIRQSGSRMPINPLDKNPRTWRNFWDVSEGVRVMLMLADANVPSDYEDDQLRDFLVNHIEFFSETCDLSDPDRINVNVLWPEIAQYVQDWQDTRRKDPWGTGRTMSQALADAGVEPPQWPRKTKTPPQPKAKELDDEIPF